MSYFYELFSIFIDDLVKYINKANIGCRIGANCTAILYADDVILLAPSVQALQSLVDIGVGASELEFLDMVINVGKSACMRFGPRFKNACVDIVVSGYSIKWEMSARYLGVYLENSTKFKCSFSKKQSGIF